MTKIKLIELTRLNASGLKANIVMQGGKYHYEYQDTPKIRTLKKVTLHNHQGTQWIKWEWHPEADKDISDCGYSSIGDCENHRIKKVYLWVEKAEKTRKREGIL